MKRLLYTCITAVLLYGIYQYAEKIGDYSALGAEPYAEEISRSEEESSLIEGEAESSMILEDQDFVYIYIGCEIVKINKKSKNCDVLWKSDYTEQFMPDTKALLIGDKIYFLEEWWSISSCGMENALSVINTDGTDYMRMEEIRGHDLCFADGILYVATYDPDSMLEYKLYADGTWKKKEAVTKYKDRKFVSESDEKYAYVITRNYNEDSLFSQDEFVGVSAGIFGGASWDYADRVLGVCDKYIYYVGEIDYKLYLMRRRLDEPSEEEVLGAAFYDSGISEVGSLISCHERNCSEENADDYLTAVDFERLVVDERFPGAAEINRIFIEKQEEIIAYEKKNAVDVEQELQAMKEAMPDANPSLHYSYGSRISPIYYFDGSYLSFYQEDDDYCGGAHGSLYREGYTFDLQTGKRLTLQDIIGNSEEELKDIVTQYFSVYIDENANTFREDAKSSVKEQINLGSDFYLREDGICFYFQPYALAAFAAGFPEVTIPYEEFEIKIPIDHEDENIKVLGQYEENTETIEFPSGEYATQEDIIRISQLHKLKHLNISITDEEIDLSPLGNLTELKTLRIVITPECNAELSFMQKLNQLEELSFWIGNDDIDLSPIGNLESLKKLEITTWRGDYSWLMKLNELTELDIIQSELADLSLFRDLSHLKVLSVEYVGDVDLSYLSELKELEWLEITGRHIRNAEGLSDLVCLKSISLFDDFYYGAGEIKTVLDLNALTGLTELEGISLLYINIEDITPLSGLSNLDWIMLVRTNVDDIQPLSTLPNLSDLQIFGNRSERVKKQAEMYFNHVENVTVTDEIPNVLSL